MIEKQNISNKNNHNVDILGFLMVIIPLLSSLLQWYWFLYFDLVQDMTDYLLAVMISTILLTTILATIDSHRIGLKIKIYKRKEIYGGSFLKFFVFLLLWIYSYPVYLFRRKNYGSRNLLYPMIFTLLIFIFSSVYLYYTVQIRLEIEQAYFKRVMHHRNLR